MRMTYETSDRGRYYSEQGTAHHQRNCRLDTVSLKTYVEVFATEQAAKFHLDDLVADLSATGSALTGELMPPSSVKLFIAEPAWIESPVRSRYRPVGEAPGEGIAFRVGKYIGSTEVDRSDADFFVETQDEELMYDMANRLISALHELAVQEGVLPILSGTQAIQMVIEHIERGEPIQYREPRAALVPDPPECDALLDQIVEEMLSDSDVGSATEGEEYAMLCVERPRQEWEEAGRPMFDYKWSEDAECWEWDRRIRTEPEGVEPVRFDLHRIPWDAVFHHEEDIQRESAELEKLLQEYEDFLDPEYESDTPSTLQELASVPHWVVTGAGPDDNV
jgi:hypothetical protein